MEANNNDEVYEVLDLPLKTVSVVCLESAISYDYQNTTIRKALVTAALQSVDNNFDFKTYPNAILRLGSQVEATPNGVAQLEYKQYMFCAALR